MENLLEIDMLLEEMEDTTAKTIASYKNELQSVKAGRANPHILDKVLVDYYGTPTPINQMGNITVAEARVLVISVWDASCLKTVEKAIIAANLGIMPNNDGKVLRMIFPELTEEKRKLLVKDVKNIAEKAKIAIRNHRRDANEEVKKLKNDKKITEDDVKELSKDIDKKCNDGIENVDNILKEKEKEIMSV